MAYRAYRRIAALYATEGKLSRPRVDNPKPDKRQVIAELDR